MIFYFFIRPRLDVHEETSIAETNYSSDSFDSDWDTSVASPNSIESSANPREITTQSPDPLQNRPGMVRLRGDQTSEDSQEIQLETGYSSVEDLGGGFSSFGPLPPVQFRTKPIEERGVEEHTLQNPSSSHSRMSFTNELFKAVHNPENDDPDEEGAIREGFRGKDISGLSNRGYDVEEEQRGKNITPCGASDAKKSVTSTVPKEIEEMYAKVDKTKMKKNRRTDSSSGSEGPDDTSRRAIGQSMINGHDLDEEGAIHKDTHEKDISGLSNGEYDEDEEQLGKNITPSGTSHAKKLAASTVPKDIEKMYAKVDKTKMKTNRGKDSSSGSEGPDDTLRGANGQSNMQAQVHQAPRHAEKSAHDPVVVYDERTNL